jgi:hypothetical protein
VKICDGPMFHLGTTGNDDEMLAAKQDYSNLKSLKN